MQSGLFSGHLPSLSDQAVVTAANEALRGGRGVKSVVCRAVGPELAAPYWAACFLPGRRRANPPPGFHLVESHVIHVGETKIK